VVAASKNEITLLRRLGYAGADAALTARNFVSGDDTPAAE
jgi:hypothetical protein